MNPTTQSSTTSTHPARQQRILRLPEVKAKTGFGRSTIYAPFYIKRGANGEFPRSIRIGARAVGWREATEGLSRACAAKALMAAGYLVPDGNRPQRKVSLPDNTRPRMYCVKGIISDDKKGDESCLGLSPCSVPPVNLRAGRGLKAKADNTASVLVVYLL